MAIAATVFLWANRIVFTMVLLYPRRYNRTMVPSSYDRNARIIAGWQIVGSFIIPGILKMSPFHLAWWYMAGWALLTVIIMIAKAIFPDAIDS